MADCIDCGDDIGGATGLSICMVCAGKRADALPLNELIAMAKVGACAVVDEITGYQKIRTKGELRKIYDEHIGGK